MSLTSCLNLGKPLLAPLSLSFHVCKVGILKPALIPTQNWLRPLYQSSGEGSANPARPLEPSSPEPPLLRWEKIPDSTQASF